MAMSNACDYGVHEKCACPMTCGCPCHGEFREPLDDFPEDAYDDFDQESEPGDGEPEPGELCEHCGKPLEEYLYTPVSVKVPAYYGCDCRA